MRYFGSEDGEAVFNTDNEAAAKGYLESGCVEIDEETYKQTLDYLGVVPTESGSTKPIVEASALPTTRRREPNQVKPPAKVTKPKPATSHMTPVIDALKFVSQAASIDSGEHYQRHVVIKNGMAVQFDGMISAGHPINLDIECAPKTDQLLAAIKKIGDSGSFTLVDGVLSVKGDRLRASVQVLPLSDIPMQGPDPSALPVSEGLRVALASAAMFSDDHADRPALASVLFRAHTVVGTSGKVLVEVYHGLNIPFPMVIPKKAIAAFCKANKPLKSIGASFENGKARTFTMYFDDGAWIKTALFADEWPDVDAVMQSFNSANFKPIPEGFFEGAKTLKPFLGDKNALHFCGNSIKTHLDDSQGASYDVTDMPSSKAINGVDVLKLEEQFTTADLFGDQFKVFFMGDNIRAILTTFG